MPSPTPEQQAIIEFMKTRDENLMVEALAGTGKTSTAEMVANIISDRAILYLAFNRRIVEEAVKRMPPHVECRTQNSLGHRVWGQAIGRRLVVDPDKNRNILKLLINDLPRKAQEEAWDDYGETMRWVSRAKRDGYVPEAFRGAHRALYDDRADWLARYDDVPSRQQIQLIDDVLLRSIEAAYAGGIDYDDQIYMPVIFGGPWPKFPLVIVDEVQDYNPLGHEMLARLLHQRLLAVGDPHQSIYAFRGAICNGMALMRERFAMHTLPLNVTFRVPHSGVRRAQARIPHYEAFHANPEGEVIVLDEWSAASIPDDAAIICRNNAPLLSLAFRLLRQGRAVRMVGFDIGAGLVRTLKKLGPPTTATKSAVVLLEQWRDDQLAGGKKVATVMDRFECLLALIEPHPSLGDAIITADKLFKEQKGINLLSGHKSKGLEFDTVFHLDPQRIPSPYAFTEEAKEQEYNVAYVIETRFKQTLYIVTLDAFHT